MLISVSENTEELTDFQKDLLARLHVLIGIAMDNALLYQQVQEQQFIAYQQVLILGHSLITQH